MNVNERLNLTITDFFGRAINIINSIKNISLKTLTIEKSIVLNRKSLIRYCANNDIVIIFKNELNAIKYKKKLDDYDNFMIDIYGDKYAVDTIDVPF